MNSGRQLHRPSHAPDPRSSRALPVLAVRPPLDISAELRVDVRLRASRMLEEIKDNDTYFHRIIEQLARDKGQNIVEFIAQLVMDLDPVQKIRELVAAKYETHGRFKAGEIKINGHEIGNLRLREPEAGNESVLISITATMPLIEALIRDIDATKKKFGIGVTFCELQTTPDTVEQEAKLQLDFKKGTKTPEDIKKWILTLNSMPRNKWKEFELFRSCMVELGYRINHQLKTEVNLTQTNPWISVGQIQKEMDDAAASGISPELEREIGAHREYSTSYETIYGVTVRNFKDGNKFRVGENEDGFRFRNEDEGIYIVDGDGMGGYGGGGVCNQIVLNETRANLNGDLGATIAGANQKIAEEKTARSQMGDTSIESGGTTVAIAKLTYSPSGQETIIESANVGDSLGYALSFDRTSVPITTEHSRLLELISTGWRTMIVTQEMERRLIARWPGIREGMDIMIGPNTEILASQYDKDCPRPLTVTDANSIITRTLDGTPASGVPSTNRNSLLLGIVALETDGVTDVTKSYALAEFMGTMDPVIHAERRIRFAIANDHGGKNDDRTCIAVKIGHEGETIEELKRTQKPAEILKLALTYQYQDVAIEAIDTLVEMEAIQELAQLSNEALVKDRKTREYAMKKAEETYLQDLGEISGNATKLHALSRFGEEGQIRIIKAIEEIGTEEAYVALNQIQIRVVFGYKAEEVLCEILKKQEVLKLDRTIAEVRTEDPDVATYSAGIDCYIFVSVGRNSQQTLADIRDLTKDIQRFKNRARAAAYRNALDSESVSSATRLRVARKICAILPNLDENECKLSKSKVLAATENEVDPATKREITKTAIEAGLIKGFRRILFGAKFKFEDAKEMFKKATESNGAVLLAMSLGIANVFAWMIHVGDSHTLNPIITLGKFLVFGLVGSVIYVTGIMIGVGMLLTGLEREKENKTKK